MQTSCGLLFKFKYFSFMIKPFVRQVFFFCHVFIHCSFLIILWSNSAPDFIVVVVKEFIIRGFIHFVKLISLFVQRMDFQSSVYIIICSQNFSSSIEIYRLFEFSCGNYDTELKHFIKWKNVFKYAPQICEKVII